MNRSIKFRVWHKKFKQWWGIICLNEPILSYDVDNLVFVQYTDCHDSSNNEIYAGDIIQYNNGDVIRIGYVGFMAGIFFLNYPDETDDELGYLLVSNLKVIGNKFEHSELLK